MSDRRQDHPVVRLGALRQGGVAPAVAAIVERGVSRRPGMAADLSLMVTPLLGGLPSLVKAEGRAALAKVMLGHVRIEGRIGVMRRLLGVVRIQAGWGGRGVRSDGRGGEP